MVAYPVSAIKPEGMQGCSSDVVDRLARDSWSFRGARSANPESRARNFEIPGSSFGRPGMTG
jgi:hypothetical protein